MLTPRSAAFVRAAPLPFALTVLAGLGVVAARVAALVALAVALDAGLELGGPGGRTDVAAALWWMVAAAAAELAARAVGALGAAQTATSLKRTVRRRLVDRVVRLGPGWLRQRRSGSVQAGVGDGVEALQAYVSSYLPQALIATVAPVLLVGAALVLDPATGLAAAIAVALLPVTKPLWKRLLGDRSRAHWEAYAHLSARMSEALKGMTTLTLLDAVADRRAAIAEDSARLYRSTRAGLAVSLVAYCLAGVVVGIGTAVVTALASLGVVDGALTPLTALVLALVVAEVFRPLLELENYWAAGFHGRAAAIAIADIEGASPGGDAVSPDVSGGPLSLRWEGVTFRYPGADTPALAGIDLHVRPGETLALVGRSGAGKSTLVHLLMRWFDPDTGRVLVGDVDLTTLDARSHRHRIAVVSQDVHLFGRTLAENLRLARPEASDADLTLALERAGAADLLTTLPDGLASALGERGTRLSGGERQRVAIARAFLSDAPILVLDEATSALDGHTEERVMAAVDELRRHRTTLLVAHRLSTLTRADRVAVLDAARVVEIGAPAELVERDGALARLLDAQAAVLA